MTNLLEALAAFHFLRPWWLLALLPSLAFAWLLHRRRQQAGSWAQVISPTILPYLLDRPANRQPGLARWALLCWILSVTGLAGPTWQQVPLPIHKQENALVILLDLSPSMLVEDVAPDRLTRARLKLTDILQGRREGVTALVAYAADAHVVSPLTDDTATIVSQLPALHPDIMPASGSAPEKAVELGLELALNAGHLSGDLLLITDGLTQGAQEQMETFLRGIGGFRLSVLAVGTEEGAPIPLSGGGFARDSNGAMVLARLNPGQLQNLARRQGGRFSLLTGDDSDLRYLLEPVTSGAGEKTRQLLRTFDTWDDLGYWLALPLLPLVLLAFRRGLLAVLLLAPLLAQPTLVRASIWDDLWWRPDQQGMNKLESDPQTAAELFDDRQWRGTAAYRGGDYARAAEDFADTDTARAHYNRGNALARAGDLDAAIKAYDRALALQPDMEDAAFNKQLVEQLRQQQQQQDQNQDSSNESSQQSDNNEGENREGSQGDQQQDTSNPAADSGQQNQPSGSEGDRNAQDKPDEGADSSTQSGRGTDDGQESGDQSASPEHSSTEEISGKENSDKESPGNDSAGQDAAGNRPDKQKDSVAAGDSDLSQEQQQAMEQWLRRVPDDPGGLLRNKFRYQAERRAYERQRRLRPPPDRDEEQRW